MSSVTGESEEAGAIRAASRDFGGMVRRRPAQVVRPSSAQGVVSALRRALSSGRPIAARGQGHTTRGQTLVDDGVVIDLAELRHIQVERDAGRVRVGAGASWAELLKATLAAELSPRVLTDYLGLSVGGTLSVGGFGGQSFRHGAQTDQVEELVVVTGAGELVSCSAERDRALFDAVRAGLGQCGIIVEAVVRLARAPARALVCELSYPDLRALLAEQERLVADDRFDYLLGSMLPGAGERWCFKLEAVKYQYEGGDADPRALTSDLAATGAQVRRVSYLEHATRLDALMLEMDRAGTRATFHPWMDLLVPAAAAQDVIEDALTRIEPAEIADGHLMTYPLRRSSTGTPLIGLPDSAGAFLFDILPNARSRAAVTRLEDKCRAILARARDAGSGVYPIGYPVGTSEMREEHWRQQTGAERWAAFVATRNRVVPGENLVPGAGMR